MRAGPPSVAPTSAALPCAASRCTVLLSAHHTISPAQALQPPLQPRPAAGSRRTALRRAVLAPLLIAAVLPAALPAAAFENRLPPDQMELKFKTPRTAGPKPIGIGPQSAGGLKPCTDGKPHCFSTSPEQFEDNDLFNADYGQTAEWLVPPFKFSKPLAAALADVKAAIAAYPPGQSGIDGGGFKVTSESSSAEQAYVYVQFESRRKGFIDDVEFLLVNGALELRTSSRLGYLDLGVNAKRFNWFARKFASLDGWTATPIAQKGHEEYFSLNQITDKDVSGSDATPVVKREKTIV